MSTQTQGARSVRTHSDEGVPLSIACSHCGRGVSWNKAGRLRSHALPRDMRADPKTGEQCPGSGALLCGGLTYKGVPIHG